MFHKFMRKTYYFMRFNLKFKLNIFIFNKCKEN